MWVHVGENFPSLMHTGRFFLTLIVSDEGARRRSHIFACVRDVGARCATLIFLCARDVGSGVRYPQRSRRGHVDRRNVL